jgi:hypothetical protein
MFPDSLKLSVKNFNKISVASIVAYVHTEQKEFNKKPRNSRDGLPKMFSPKNSAKKLAFLTQNKVKLCKIWIIALVFEKNAIFSAKIGKNR